jgi:hypothetical protein
MRNKIQPNQELNAIKCVNAFLCKEGTDSIKSSQLVKINQEYIEAAQIQFCYKFDLIEMSTRNLPGGKEWSARKADNLTAICESAV